MEEGFVTATPQAIELIERLRATHGDLVFFQSGGCCSGSDPVCLRQGQMLLGPGDLLIGSVAGADVYIDGDQFERWNRPLLVIDVAEGAADTFSIEGVEDVHFVLAPPDLASG